MRHSRGKPSPPTVTPSGRLSWPLRIGGAIFGPSCKPTLWRPDGEQIRFFAELGVALLLFLVGLTLDRRLVKTLGPFAVATGLGQVAFTAGLGFFIGLALGLDWLTSLYVAVALTFSSIIIVVKLLSDKRELETLHGRIALGFLIVEDIVVVTVMLVLSTIGIGAGAAGHRSSGGARSWMLRRSDAGVHQLV